MTNTLSLAILLICCISLGSPKLLDYRLQRRNESRAACPKPGPFCSNCNTATMCVADGNGGWEEMDIQTCDLDETCIDGRCTKVTNPNCNQQGNLAFRCVTSGLFPNPGDCRKYHYCVPSGTSLQEVRVECVDDGINEYGYNAKSTYCDKKLTNSVCSGYPVPFCKEKGEEAPLKENPTIYYTCLEYQGVLYPVQQACANGKIFSVQNRCK